jgi:hypothetical protein
MFHSNRSLLHWYKREHHVHQHWVSGSSWQLVAARGENNRLIIYIFTFSFSPKYGDCNCHPNLPVAALHPPREVPEASSAESLLRDSIMSSLRSVTALFAFDFTSESHLDRVKVKLTESFFSPRATFFCFYF